MNKKFIIKEIIEWAVCIVIAVVIALLIKFFLITPTIVQQTSMYPTLVHNQRLLLNRFIRTAKKTPERGEIITFEAPTSYKSISNENPMATYENEPTGLWTKFCYYVLEINKQSYIKRIIGLPGEEVKIENGKVYINGEELEESYLVDGVTTSLQNEELNHFVVPNDSVFVMGDNRKDSIDSRTFGCIPISKIEGSVILRFWPLNDFGKVD